jgi:AraC-like DNA-binding protein
MVNLQSLQSVKTELVKLGLRPIDISMGEADVLDPLTEKQLHQLGVALRQAGLELLERKVDILVHRVRQTIIGIIYEDKPPQQNLSTFLSVTLGYDYTYLSNLFSATTRITIEKYYICNRIERVKQLLLYEDLSLKEIAQKMRYSSPSHLSNQFKKITGYAPSEYKMLNRHKQLVPANCG